MGAGYCPATVPKSLLRAPAPSPTFELSDEDRFCDEGVALVSCTGSVFTVLKGVDAPVLYVGSEFGVCHWQNGIHQHQTSFESPHRNTHL